MDWVPHAVVRVKATAESFSLIVIFDPRQGLPNLVLLNNRRVRDYPNQKKLKKGTAVQWANRSTSSLDFWTSDRDRRLGDYHKGSSFVRRRTPGKTVRVWVHEHEPCLPWVIWLRSPRQLAEVVPKVMHDPLLDKIVFPRRPLTLIWESFDLSSKCSTQPDKSVKGFQNNFCLSDTHNFRDWRTSLLSI